MEFHGLHKGWSQVRSDKMPELEEAVLNSAKTHFHYVSLQNKHQKTASYNRFICLTEAVRKSHHPDEKGERPLHLAANIQLFDIVKVLKEEDESVLGMRGCSGGRSCFSAAAFGCGWQRCLNLPPMRLTWINPGYELFALRRSAVSRMP